MFSLSNPGIKDFFLSFLVSEVCRCERPAAELGTKNMKLTGQLEELVQRTERTEAEVELLLAELGTYQSSNKYRY